jgi:hypothetical protein
MGIRQRLLALSLVAAAFALPGSVAAAQPSSTATVILIIDGMT